MSDDTTIAVGEPSKYTLQFQADGNVAIRADCNQVLGRYTTSGNAQLTIELGPSTLVGCPPGSQADVFDDRVTHPWRGLVVQPGKPIQREAIEVALLALRDRIRILHHALTGLASLLGSDASELAVEALGQLAAALVELTPLDRRPPSWPTRDPGEPRDDLRPAFH